MELFLKIINFWKLLTNFEKSSILDFWQSLEYVFAMDEIFLSKYLVNTLNKQIWSFLVFSTKDVSESKTSFSPL